VEEAVTTDASQFRRTSADVADFLAKLGRLPSAVWLGSTPVPPQDYLRSSVQTRFISDTPLVKRISDVK
jgi:hypothetical protein